MAFKLLKLLAFAFIIFLAYTSLSVNMNWNLFILDWIDYLPFQDKTGHFILIGLLAFFVNVLLNFRKIDIRSRSFLLGSVLVFVFITLEEASQFFLPHRTCDLVDLLCNYAGIFVFGSLATWVGKRINYTFPQV